MYNGRVKIAEGGAVRPEKGRGKGREVEHGMRPGGRVKAEGVRAASLLEEANRGRD
jgi:hypothetical protein